MKYSRFDESRGLYDVFEDGTHRALNSDLPVPSLPPADNGIGVASRHAGRPLPAGAKLIGTSWRPQGVVVASRQGGGLGSVGESIKAHPVVFVAGTGLIVYGLFRLYVSEMAKWGER